MVIFGRKPWVNPFRKMSIFCLFQLLVFIAQKSVFSFQNMVKDIFMAYIALKDSQKKGHFWTKTLWKNVNFSTFSTSCFYSLEKGFFVLEYRKRYFSSLYCLKKKVGKRAIFGPKPWVNPFAKISIFGLFKLLVFIGQKRVFSFKNIVKDIFLVYIAKKKKLEKWPFLDQNHVKNVNFSTV